MNENIKEIRKSGRRDNADLYYIVKKEKKICTARSGHPMKYSMYLLLQVSYL